MSPSHAASLLATGTINAYAAHRPIDCMLRSDPNHAWMTYDYEHPITAFGDDLYYWRQAECPIHGWFAVYNNGDMCGPYPSVEECRLKTTPHNRSKMIPMKEVR